MKLSRAKGDRGAAAVEFALIALILITMLFLIIEGGRLFMIQAGASTAARDAARTMAISGNSEWATLDAQEVFSPYGELDSITFVQTCPDDPGPMDSVRVEVSDKVQLVTGLFGAEVPLSGKGEMRCGG